MSSGSPHILLVSTSSGSRGGGELYLVSLANALAAQGRSVSCLLSTHPRMDELAGAFEPQVTVIRESFTNTYDRPTRFLREAYGWKSVRHAAGLLKLIAPDLVHLNKQNLEDGLDWLRALDRSGIPNVTTIHVPRSMRSLGARGGAVRDRLVAPCLRTSRTRFVTVSEASRNDLCRFLGCDAASPRVVTIPNGVPDAPTADRAAIRNEWNLPPESFVLGTVARIESQKNPLFAVRLLAELPGDVHLVWVGDGRLRTQMESLARELGVGDRLHLDGWRSDARGRLAAFDAFVLPSYFEGFPLAILEAMAASRACVVSDVDGNSEAVIDGETGFVCAVDDLAAWRSRILELRASAELRARMGEAGRKRFTRLYGVRAMADATGRMYDELLSRTPMGAMP